MLEGYLRKWVNIMYGWKPRYFILHEGLLTFCDKKGGKKKGTIYLRIAEISTIAEDPLRIIINTGTSEIHIRAENVEEMKQWLDALNKAKQEDLQREHLTAYPEKTIENVEKTLSPEAKAITKDVNVDSLKEKLAQIWVCQAEFYETLSHIIPKVKMMPSLFDSMTKLEQLGNDLKYRVTDCVSKIEHEKKKIVVITKKLDQAQSKDGINKRLNFDADIGGARHHLHGRAGVDEDPEEDDNVFHSFSESYDEDDDEEEEKLPEGGQRPVKRTLSIQQQKENLDAISHQSNSLVKVHLSTNPVFVQTPVPKDNYRDKMPHWLDPNAKLNIWALAKDLVGKDLTRFAVPVWLNEPLSMLQKLCEQLEYSKLLDIGNQKDDSCLRMAYVMAFSFAYYAGTIGRHKKPFNPVLGETFEYVPVDGSFKFLSEQVSHHPPVSAGFADSPSFQWWGDTQIKTNFKGASLDVKTMGSCHTILKKHDDHIIYKRPITAVYNIIVGSMYIENYGEMPFNNTKTGDTAELNLKKRGWTGKGAFEAEGWIKDKAGNLRYTLHGKWDSYLTIVDANTKRETKVWERYPIPENYEQQYCFSNYTKQLNYIYDELTKHLPLTDCRLRPDQRALEYGLFDLAKDEKHRIEEKQRARRKDLQLKGETHKARWFKEVTDEATGEKSYSYLGGYWECREKGDFGEVLDLF